MSIDEATPQRVPYAQWLQRSADSAWRVGAACAEAQAQWAAACGAALTATLQENLRLLRVPGSRDDLAQSAWAWPTLQRLQAQRAAHALQDAARMSAELQARVARSLGDALLAWGQFASQQALTVNQAVVERRVHRNVIDFPERRRRPS